MDRASQVLAQSLPPHVPRTYAALTEQGDGQLVQNVHWQKNLQSAPETQGDRLLASYPLGR